MPPVPPRRRVPPLLAPRDVTETAQQKQGIDDLEALRQAGVEAGKQVLGALPVTGEAMAAKDFAEAAQRRDKLGMALATLGVLPFGRVVGKAVREAAPAAREMSREAMDEALRVARGQEYFPQEVYHSTGVTQPIEEFIPMTGRQWHDLPGTHVGTRKAAQQRAAGKFGITSWDKPLTKKRFVDMGEQAPSVMPLQMRMEDPYLNQGVPFKEEELQNAVRTFAEQEGYLPKGGNKYGIPGAQVVGEERGPDFWQQMAAAQKAFADRLIAKGHDVVPYVNKVEDEGKLSYLVLEPNRLRSRFAQFDPAKLESKDLMAGLAAMLGGSALRPSSGSSER